MALPFLRAWREVRGREGRAREYVATLMTEPPADFCVQLAAAGDGDEDHARWELRYARRAIGLLIAERDALDDRTSSEVAAELSVAHGADANIAPDRREIADRQLNDRLRGYRAAMADRSGTARTAERLAVTLLRFAGAPPGKSEAVPFAADVTGAMVLECNASLRKAFGEASLPADVKPSEIR